MYSIVPLSLVTFPVTGLSVEEVSADARSRPQVYDNLLKNTMSAVQQRVAKLCHVPSTYIRRPITHSMSYFNK